MTLTLHELTEKIGTNPTMESLLLSVEEYSEFTENISETGREILSGVSKDDLYTAITLIQSFAVADVMNSGDVTMQQLKFLISPAFAGMVATIVKLAVGLAANEELR